MKRAKAEKHLKYAREHLQYLRELYVRRMRDNGWKQLDREGFLGNNIYKEMLEGIKKEMEETKGRIAKFERIAL